MLASWSACISLDAALRDWLLSSGSLTARLQANGRFSVCPLFSGVAMASVSEARALGLPRPQRVYVRQTCLLVDDIPRVLARSVTSLSALRRSWRALRGLGRRPLGALLHGHPQVCRGRMHFSRARAGHDVHQHLQRFYGPLPRQLPMRRSRFWLRDQPLLVLEAFLPEVAPLSARAGGRAARPVHPRPEAAHLAAAAPAGF